MGKRVLQWDIKRHIPTVVIMVLKGGLIFSGLVPGRGVFLKDKCPVSSCVISSNRDEAENADLLLFKVSWELIAESASCGAHKSF
jgi:hypothetical protein